MTLDLKAELEKWNDEKTGYDLIGRIEESPINKDSLDILIEDDDKSDSYRLDIPMTPTNIEVLKEQLREAEVGVRKETDSRGRFNLGTEHADEEKTVIVLDG